jgi:hypothetical protein
LTKKGLLTTDSDKSKDSKESDGEQKSRKKQKLFLPQLESKFEKSQIYGSDKVAFSIFSSTYETVETILFMLFGFLPYTWDVAANLGASGKLGFTVEGEIGVSLLFMAIIQFIGTVTGLPFELVREIDTIVV